MSTASAFLSDIQVLIEENDIVRTGIDTILAASALHWVDNDKAIVSLVNSSFDWASIHAGSLIAMHAEMGTVSHFNFWHSPSHFFSKLKPELPGVGLWLGDRCPIICDMFIFANDLTRMTSVTLRYINNKYLLRHGHLSP
jgi:hypothetical protein